MSPAEIELAKLAIQYIGVPLIGAIAGWLAQKRKTIKAKKMLKASCKGVEASNNKLIKYQIQGYAENMGVEKDLNKYVKTEIEQPKTKNERIKNETK